jgi:hypothetical protein
VSKYNLDNNGGNMGLILGIGIILLILWALGLFVFSWGAIVYIALVVAVILIVIWLIRAVFRRT